MKRSERGSNLVEMALIAPVLLIILFGIADVGRAFSGYITMTNAVREGARYAARRPLETENIQKRTFVEIDNANGSLRCDSPPEVDTEADGSGTAKRVTLTCIFSTITPLIGAFPMTATAAMKVEGPQ
jgi:hypothetical protein